MARYLVENSRPRQIVTVFGKTLASSFSSSRGRPGRVWLSEEQFASAQVQRLVEAKRLKLVETEHAKDEPSPEKVAVMRPPSASEAPAQVSITPDDPAPAAPGESPGVSDDAAPPADAAGSTSATPATPPTTYTREELELLSYQELRAMAESRGLPTGGKAEKLVARILASQEQP